ncbi:uncharacterized protein LOC122064833 [Macadamia integrifolia]|uniref:uncharacterized protein LOC122064833 n=1 Tax=Macadamia integrifolia TaxID=60698 RepID=UPI001C4FFB41|nr:uncharacterized protein LOC122064833 [Macadamia integrifolia]
MHLHRQLLNDHYANAVKHLRLAINSTPPELAALLPLIQPFVVCLGFWCIAYSFRACLLSGQNWGGNYMTLSGNILRASITECFHLKQYDVLSTCYEDILKKDPMCIHSSILLDNGVPCFWMVIKIGVKIPCTMYMYLSKDEPQMMVDWEVMLEEEKRKLYGVLQYSSYRPSTGDYNLEPLVEMIALHLDATYATCDIWGELASCFLKISLYEDDQMSVCGNENECGGKQQFSVCFNSIPRSFIEGNLRMPWKLRCKWWSRRHFSNNILDSEMKAGKFQLLTCKAACASHLYGPEFKYVESVYACLEKEDNQERILFLQKHTNNSIKLLQNL